MTEEEFNNLEVGDTLVSPKNNKWIVQINKYFDGRHSVTIECPDLYGSKRKEIMERVSFGFFFGPDEWTIVKKIVDLI